MRENKQGNVLEGNKESEHWSTISAVNSMVSYKHKMANFRKQYV